MLGSGGFSRGSMNTELKLFRLNRGLPNEFFEMVNNILASELCSQNLKNGIETTIFLDTNILSNIRKFTFKEQSLDSRVHNIIERVIEIFSKLSNVYISPGFGIYESCDLLKEKNIMAFNIFLEQYLPKYGEAYNAQNNQSLQEDETFYLLNTCASIFAVHYVRKKYSHLLAIERFKKFLGLLQEHLNFIDALVCEIAKYAFLDSDECSEIHKKIVKNFIKSCDTKKQSLNAAYDLLLIRVIAMSHDQTLPSFVGRMDNWGLTTDQGIIEFANLISFGKKSGPLISVDLINTENHEDYFSQCSTYYDSIVWQRLNNPIIQKNLRDKVITLNKAKSFISKLESEALPA